MKLGGLFFLFLGLALGGVRSVEAQKNNKFGIHLAVPSEQDLKDAAKLVNSTGGDWGYVTLVLQEDDKDRKKWQDVFDFCRELHLIPIIRLATSPQKEGFWRRPQTEKSGFWVEFLDSLNWVTKNRYLVLFNEPNHAVEWGGEVDSGSYGRLVLEFAKKLKQKNPDFFVMLSGFDAAAPQKPPLFGDEAVFLRKMGEGLPDGLPTLFEFIDGWVSHSYPNHGFVSSPYKTGRHSIKTYEWELSFLKQLGVKKELPVFITETGWDQTRIDFDTIAKYFQIVFEKVWLPDNRVWAVTPFILNYPEDLFVRFSWKKPGEAVFYPHYGKVKGLTKEAGEPQQVNPLKLKNSLPAKLTWDSTCELKVEIENHGQAIWREEEGHSLKFLDSKKAEFEYLFSGLGKIKPFETKVEFKQLLPFDFNQDGRFSLKDLFFLAVFLR